MPANNNICSLFCPQWSTLTCALSSYWGEETGFLCPCEDNCNFIMVYHLSYSSYSYTYSSCVFYCCLFALTLSILSVVMYHRLNNWGEVKIHLCIFAWLWLLQNTYMLHNLIFTQYILFLLIIHNGDDLFSFLVLDLVRSPSAEGSTLIHKPESLPLSDSGRGITRGGQSDFELCPLPFLDPPSTHIFV